jgi:hypothetical protein
MKVIRDRIKRWDDGDIVTLMVDLEAHDAAGVLLAEERGHKKRDAVLSLKNRLNSCYEFTRACTYNKACEVMYGTPKWDGDVEKELKPLYPFRPEVLFDESDNKPLPVTTKWNFSKALSRQEVGSTPSPSGNRMGHHRQADVIPVDDDEAPLEKRDPWHYTRQLCALLASGQHEWGDKSNEMHEMCFAISLTVLQKDPVKKRPRPIGSGASPLRKLGNCMLIQVAAATMAEVMTRVINLVHGGKGANDIIPLFFQLMTEMDDDETKIKGPFGVASTDGRNAFGAMKRTEVQHGLDQFLPEELFWMKKMFWRFHVGSTTVYYKQLDGQIIVLKVTTGFIQGEHFSGFWHATGQGPSFHILLDEFGEEEVLALPFADDVPFMVRVNRRVKIDDHPRLLEFPWAKAGETCSVGKAVIYRWSQLSKHNMGVDVVLTGANKNLAYLPARPAIKVGQLDSSRFMLLTRAEAGKCRSKPSKAFSIPLKKVESHPQWQHSTPDPP